MSCGWPCPRVRGAVPLDGRCVELDAEAGSGRQLDHSVDDLGLGRDELAPERRVEEVGGEVLDERDVRRRRLEVARGSGRDPGLPPVRHDEHAGHLGELGDPDHLGQPARPVDVGLEDVHAAALDPLAALEARRGHLGAADARLGTRRELRVALEVVVLERRLGQVEVTVLEPVQRPQRCPPVAPAVPEVDEERRVFADEPPALPDAADQLAIADEVAEEGLHLDRAEAELERAVEPARELVHELADRAVAGDPWIDRRVGPDRIAASAAEELIRRAVPTACRRGRATRRRQPRARGFRARAARGRGSPGTGRRGGSRARTGRAPAARSAARGSTRGDPPSRRAPSRPAPGHPPRRSPPCRPRRGSRRRRSRRSCRSRSGRSRARGGRSPRRRR